MAIGNVVFNDPMTDPDGTALTAHMAVTTWVQDYAPRGLVITTNRCAVASYTSGTARGHSSDTVANNQRVSGNIIIGSENSNTGLVARYIHLSGSTFGYTGYQVTTRPSVQFVMCYRVDNGTRTQIANYTGADVVDGAKYGVECDGTTIKLLVTDVVKASVVDATYASGGAGLFCSWTRSLDNVLAEDDATGATVVIVGLAGETDTALGVSALKTRAVGQAAETDTALGITAAKTRAVGQGAEADTALGVAATKTRTVGQAAEADTALGVAAAKTRAVGIAAEADTALALVGAAKIVVVGQAVEADTALPVAGAKTRAVGQAVEADTALGVGAAKTRAVGQALETDAALGVTALKTRAVGLAASFEAALAVTIVKAVVIGQAGEADLALGVSSLKTRTVGQAFETDTALGLVFGTGVPPFMAMLSDSGAGMSLSSTAAKATVRT